MALRVRDRLKTLFTAEVDLVKSSGGVFEIERDGVLVFSKKKLDRFPSEQEVERMGGDKGQS
jgi:selT/selW/selH-like putative selenoprotein